MTDRARIAFATAGALIAFVLVAYVRFVVRFAVCVVAVYIVLVAVWLAAAFAIGIVDG